MHFFACLAFALTLSSLGGASPILFELDSTSSTGLTTFKRAEVIFQHHKSTFTRSISLRENDYSRILSASLGSQNVRQKYKAAVPPSMESQSILPAITLPAPPRLSVAEIVILATLLPSFLILTLFACWMEHLHCRGPRPKPPTALSGGTEAWQQQRPVGDWTSLPGIEPIHVPVESRGRREAVRGAPRVQWAEEGLPGYEMAARRVDRV